MAHREFAETRRHLTDLVAFELGGLSCEVIATPGAEGADAVSVWLPGQMILFSGDLYPVPALELLPQRGRGVNHHEVLWLEHRIARTRPALGS